MRTAAHYGCAMADPRPGGVSHRFKAMMPTASVKRLSGIRLDSRTR